jgi:spermidine synthase
VLVSRPRGVKGRIQVHSGRHGVVLRIHGTRASALRPGRISAGPVWDALAMSALALPSPPRAVAMLGLGGGSAARVLRALAPGAHIVGIERDAHVIEAARQVLGLDDLDLEVVTGDALEWLRRERRRFDIVIEDLFVGPLRTVRKPDWLPEPGLGLARRRLRPGGLIASNTIHETPAMRRALLRLFPAVLSLDVAEHHNQILIAGERLPAPRALRTAARAHDDLHDSLRQLRFRTIRG